MKFSTQTVRWLDKKTASHPGLGTSDGYMSHFGHFVAREGYNKNYHQHFSAITRQRKCLASCRHLRPERKEKTIGPSRDRTQDLLGKRLSLSLVLHCLLGSLEEWCRNPLTCRRKYRVTLARGDLSNRSRRLSIGPPLKPLGHFSAEQIFSLSTNNLTYQWDRYEAFISCQAKELHVWPWRAPLC